MQKKPIEVASKPVEKTPLNLAMPDPIRTKPIQWIVVTKDNAAEVFSRLESKDQEAVVFALTDDGYQQLSVTVAELRNLVARQRSIILKYKEYYEQPAPPK